MDFTATSLWTLSVFVLKVHILIHHKATTVYYNYTIKTA